MRPRSSPDHILVNEKAGAVPSAYEIIFTIRSLSWRRSLRESSCMIHNHHLRRDKPTTACQRYIPAGGVPTLPPYIENNAPSITIYPEAPSSVDPRRRHQSLAHPRPTLHRARCQSPCCWTPGWLSVGEEACASGRRHRLCPVSGFLLPTNWQQGAGDGAQATISNMDSASSPNRHPPSAQHHGRSQRDRRTVDHDSARQLMGSTVIYWVARRAPPDVVTPAPGWPTVRDQGRSVGDACKRWSFVIRGADIICRLLPR